MRGIPANIGWLATLLLQSLYQEFLPWKSSVQSMKLVMDTTQYQGSESVHVRPPRHRHDSSAQVKLLASHMFVFQHSLQLKGHQLTVILKTICS